MPFKSVVNRVLCFPVLAVVIVGISSCKKSSVAATSSVQLVNASPDAGPVNFYLSGNLKTANPVSYGNTSGYFSVVAGNQTGEIKTAANLTTVVPLNLAQDLHYSVFLCGQSATAALGSIVVQDDLSSPTSGTAKIRFVNAVANSNIEFTIDNPTAILFFKNIAYKAATDFYNGISPGTHYITVTAYGQAFTTPGVNPTLATASLTFVSGKIYTVFFKGQLGTTAGNAKMDLGAITHN